MQILGLKKTGSAERIQPGEALTNKSYFVSLNLQSGWLR